MNKLPIEITEYIFFFIPYKYLASLNKSNYDKHNDKKRDSIPKNLFHSYIRDIIRRDYSFILEYIINQYYNHWKKPIQYRYKSSTYGSYYIYLIHYSREHDSLKCLYLLRDKYKTKVKQHKNVRSKK